MTRTRPSCPALLVLALLLALPAVASANGVGVLARSGDKLTTVISAPGDEDAFAVELAEGGKLNVAMKVAKGVDLNPGIRVFGPAGGEIDVTALLKKPGTAKVSLKKLVATETGLHKILISGEGGTTGEYTAAFKFKNPKAWKVKDLAVPAGETRSLEFAAMPDALLTVAVKETDGPPLAGLEILDPDGGVLADATAFLRKKTNLSVKALPVTRGGFGTWRIEFTGGTAATMLKVSVKVKAPKFAKRKEILPPEASLTSATPDVVFQEDVGTSLILAGADILAGSTVVFLSGDVVVRNTAVNGPAGVTVTVDVPADAPFGPRDATLIPPPLLGEPVTLAGAVTVQAPDPTVTGATLSVVKQGQTSAVLEIDGTGFRTGGTIDVGGAGLTMGTTTVLSPTKARVTVSAAIDAPVEPRDVTFTQPAAGGGASAGASGIVFVHYPDPALTVVSPTSVRQEASGIVLTLTGEHFRDGGYVVIDGVTVSNPTFVSPTEFEVTVAVAAEAAFGGRTVQYIQPSDGGGASTSLDDVFEVLAPVPTVTGATPNVLLQEQDDVLITLTGTGFRAGGTVTIEGTGVTVGATTVVSPVQATFRVSADEFATTGLRDVTFTQPAAGGADSGTGPDLLRIDNPSPTLTGVGPSDIVRQGVSAALSLSGTGFRSGGVIAVDGVTVASTYVSSTRIDFSFTPALDAAYGSRSVRYTQPTGAFSVLATGLTVQAPVPTVASVSPGVLTQGAGSTEITVTGTGFRSGGSLSFSGVGIAAGATTVDSATSARVTVTVDADATAGTRDVTFTQPAAGGAATGTSAGALSIHFPTPTLAVVTPAGVKQGSTAAVLTLNGTNFRSGGTVSASGTGLTFKSPTWVSDTTFRVEVDVADAAAYGARTVRYTHSAAGGGAWSELPSAVTVLAPDPTVTAVSPDAVVEGAASVTVTVTGTGFRSGGAVTISGTGLTVGSTTFVSSTQATIPVSAAVGATFGARDVTWTQPAAGGGGSGVGTGLLAVHAPTPTVVSVTPGALVQGDSAVVVTLTGTNFRAGGTVSFGGSGITTSSPTWVSNSLFNVTVTVAAAADPGSRDVTYAQPTAGGGKSDTLDDGIDIHAPTPTVSAISPSTLKQLQGATVLTVTGTNFRAGGTLGISGTGLTVGSTTVDSATQARVTVSVAASATVGTRDVTFTQSATSGGATGTGSDLLSIHHPDPTFTLVDETELRRSDTGTFTLTGTNFRSGGTVTTTSSGVTLSSPTYVSGTSFTVGYSVAAAATLGTFNLTYQQPVAGGGATATLTNAYEIFASGPRVDDVSPDAFRPGDSCLTLIVDGDYFDSGSVVSFSGSGITVHSTTYVSATELNVVISVASGTTLGARDMTVTPGTGPAKLCDDLVTVVPADPTVTSFSHGTLAKGASSIAVTVGGTNFRSGDTLSAGGTGVTFASVTVVDDTSITANATVTSGATVGLRDLTVAHSTTNGARSGTLEDAFEVISASPTVTSLHPASIARTGTGGATRDVPVEITGTNFMTGATVSVAKSGGSGVTVVSGSEEVLSDTSLAFEVRVTGAATTGTWAVSVANPGTLGSSGTVNLTVSAASTFLVDQVLPATGSAHGGERVTIRGGGFAEGAVVDFGTARAYGTVRIDNNTITTIVPQPSSTSSTAATAVTVKVTNPSTSSASLTGGYAYALDDVTFFIDDVLPATNATGVAASLRSAVVKLSAPADTTTGAYGSSTTANVLWFESGGSMVSGGLRGFGPNKRWLVFSRATTTALPAANAGKYVLNVPGALQSIGGVGLTPVIVSSSTVDQSWFTISTTTSDTTAPTLSSITPTNTATGISTTTTVALTFSEEIDPITVTTTNFTLKQSATSIGCHLEVSDDLKTVTLTPETELTANKLYTVGVTTSVKDLHGNAIASALSRTFTTATSDTAKPTMVVRLERLPTSVDGSGTYVNTSGTGGNAFDAYTAQEGFLIRVEYSDSGGAGIDPTTFSAKVDVKVGSTNANTELASKFTVTHTYAEWVVDETVTAGDNVTWTFLIKDAASTPNTSSSVTFDIDVVDISGTASGTEGGDLDPMDERDTWVLRGDLDVYTATFVSRTTPSTEQGVTTTVAANRISDLDESLRLLGLTTASMTTDAAGTVNGISTGTNAIVSRLFMERVREVVRARFGIDEDGTRYDDSIDIEFLLSGEQGSLSSLPTLSTADTYSSSKDFSEMSIGGTAGADSSAYASSSILGRAWYDNRNLDEEADINSDGDVGVFLLGMGKSQVNRTYGEFRDVISTVFVKVHGGTPVGESALDDDVLSDGFDRTAAGNSTAENARYDAIMDAVDLLARYTASVTAHEIGHSIGLVPDGAPKTGLFGKAHENNTFTDATSTSTNTSHHLDFAGMNDLMPASTSVTAATRSGSDAKRFNPMNLAYLLSRLAYDEGK